MALRSLSLLSLCLTMISGCGEPSNRLPVYPVQGVVQWNGKPLGNAMVTLHPVDKSDSRATTARATTDANGKFVVSTYDAHDGAPEGEYKVTVERYQLKGSGSNLEPGPNMLPAKYSQPTTTGASLRVARGNNQQQVIDLR